MDADTTQPHGTTAAAIGRALALPEIIALITSYLGPAEILACSAVSSVLREYFAPYVWQDLSFGPPWPESDAAFPRCISSEGLPDITSHVTDQNRKESRDQILATFKHIAPWVRTLTINNHKSIFPLQLGAACRQLQSLTITEILPKDADCSITLAHWINCKTMMRRNRDHLRSLSLVCWTHDYSKRLQPGQPNWNPILSCTKSYNLRSLKLENFSIRGRHMAAFWIVCSRLESLSMVDVRLHLDLPHPSPARRNKSTTAKDNCSEGLPSHTAPTVRFPLLRNLMLSGLDHSAVHQLDLLISQCPALRTLDWQMYYVIPFPTKAFINRLMSSTWPELDSIVLYDRNVPITDEEFREILLAARNPMRKLDIERNSMTPETFDVYRTRHFYTLGSIDIADDAGNTGNTSQWIIDILTLCPSLRYLRASTLHAEDILKNSKPWICHGLQEMTVFINMGFPNRGNYRRFTEEELDKCRAIFKQLATLKELQVLDMLSTHPQTLHAPIDNIYFSFKPLVEDHTVPLPLRLKAGLSVLKGLRKLRMVGFKSGRHRMPMKELNWMVQHWKRLERLAGGWMVLGKLGESWPGCPWTKEQTAWLEMRHINMSGSRYEHYKDWDPEVRDCEDWCGLSDEEDEDVGSSS